MGIDVDRTLMRGKLAELKEERLKLRLKAEGLCDSIRTTLNPALNPVAEMEIAQAANQMDELTVANIDLLDVLTQIQRLEKSLNG